MTRTAVVWYAFSGSSVSQQLRQLVLAIPPLRSDLRCVDVYERFVADPELLTAAVIDADGVPLGLVNRHEFFLELAHQYGRALYDRKPITVLMKAEPLIVDVDASLDALNDRIVSDAQSALLRGFIVTRHGRYLGVGTALSLLQLNVQHMQARASELDEARCNAEQANRAKSQFLAGMSHELRTPLNAILGFSEIIRDRSLGGIDVAKLREYADDIHQSGRHLLNVVNDVLDMAKIEAGKVELEDNQIDIGDSIERSIKFLATHAEAADVALETRVPAGLPLLRADEVKLRQVLLNLLSNAVKFTPGGGHVRVEAAADRRRGLTITVQDTGIGIAPPDIPHVLQPFGQADSGFARKYDGAGLGLPLARSIVELHGGDLILDSAVGVGTTVRVRLPADRLIADAA